MFERATSAAKIRIEPNDLDVPALSPGACEIGNFLALATVSEVSKPPAASETAASWPFLSAIPVA
jgi:hypothetical protein